MRKLRKVNRLDHFDCLRVAQNRRAELTDRELVTLNRVAGAWACNEPIESDVLAAARQIVTRMDATPKPTA